MVEPESEVSQMACHPEPELWPHRLLLIQYFPTSTAQKGAEQPAARVVVGAVVIVTARNKANARPVEKKRRTWREQLMGM
jgi:hypothetical protein